jgi:hypothetical protein
MKYQMERNQIIKKTTTNVLLDELITQMEAEQAAPSEPAKPLEVTEEAKIKMRQLMDEYLVIKDKIAKN